ncbi:MAG: hypothetical protein WB646_08835 [Steroidobacteraceae bacterium]
MSIKVSLILGGTAVGCLTLAACNSGESTASVPSTMPVVTKQLDTAEVLSIAQTTTSETSSPFPVDGGAVVVTPADDETGTPIPVNAI